MCSRTKFFLFGILFFSLYGLAQDIIIPYKSDWKFFRGKTQPPADWQAVDFNDATWEEGKAPLGYGALEASYINTIIADMQNNYYSVFFRKEFEIADVFPVKSLALSVNYDDGFVAYLNGKRIAYKGLTITNPPYNVTATSHESDPAGDGEEMTISPTAISYLNTGKNVFSIQVHNTTIGSSDLFMDLQFSVFYNENPYPCVWEFSCVDKGDSVVAFDWKIPSGSFLDSIEVREGDEVIAEAGGEETEVLVTGITEGEHLYRIFGKKDTSSKDCYGGFCSLTVSPVMYFVRGDINDDGSVNIVDPIFLAHYLFQEGEQPSCFDACDIDDNGELNLADIVAELNYLFDSGDVPPAPGPSDCGVDGVLDELPICQFSNCDQGAAIGN